jgi:hypothetical protein
MPDVITILATLQKAKEYYDTAVELYESSKDVISTQDQEKILGEIAELQKKNDQIHQDLQARLRG